MRERKSRKGGFTLVEIMIVVSIIGLLAAIAIPNFVKARTTAQKNACINNLRQIDGAIQQWALENRKAEIDQVTIDNIVGYLRAAVSCPAGGGKTMAECYGVTDCKTPPTCTIGGNLPPPNTHSLNSSP
jgi:prepilin-type N-terminal cleavage/methylation domain-containing protein